LLKNTDKFCLKLKSNEYLPFLTNETSSL
jgi:hypothetical protein